MIDYQTVPPELLNVEAYQTLQHLKGQALDILGYCRAYRTGFMNEPGDTQEVNVINCTMHTPTPAQLKDLNDLAYANNKVVVMVGGQLGLITQVIKVLNNNDFYVVEAITSRVASEVKLPDGTVKKTSVFKYEGLRRLY